MARQPSREDNKRSDNRQNKTTFKRRLQDKTTREATTVNRRQPSREDKLQEKTNFKR